jgi:hypothetical protein
MLRGDRAAYDCNTAGIQASGYKQARIPAYVHRYISMSNLLTAKELF